MRHVKLVLAGLIFTGAWHSAEPEHSAILQQKGELVRLVVLDAARRPIAAAQIKLMEETDKCVTAPCPPATVIWAQNSGADGSVTVPRKLIHETTLVGTRGYEPREIRDTTWHKDGEGWVIRLMGSVTTVCSKLGARWTIRVAEDWRSAQVNFGESGDMGLMQCNEGKDIFLTCQGPQIPDAGFTASFTRSGDSISARLIGETKGGPREFAKLDCFRSGSAEALPRGLTEWTLEYSLTGGIAGLNRHLRLKQTGELDVSAGSEPGSSHITAHASAEVMAKITDFLKIAQRAEPASPTPMPDALYTSLALISGGSKYELIAPEDIEKLLEDTLDTTLKKAVVGAWVESEWKLCRPAAQLTAEQMDTPIERLVFQDDGGFSVTWRGGGARVYGNPSGNPPHTTIPDYSGRYVIQPDRGYIQMTFEHGIHTPRDFSGDGFFQRNGSKLILKNVWLGTYTAKQKPDICLLTFTYLSEPEHARERMHK